MKNGPILNDGLAC